MTSCKLLLGALSQNQKTGDMRRLTAYIHWLICCGGAVACLAGCAITPPVPTTAEPRASLPRPGPLEVPVGKQALAIFPWSITGGFEDVDQAEPEGIRALEAALNGTAFVPIYSYYELEQHSIQRLARKDFPDLRRVWRRQRPNVETIVHLGTELGVQAVFLYDMEVLVGRDFLRAYLVDVATQKLYEARGEIYDFAESAYDTLLGIARYVLAAYRRHAHIGFQGRELENRVN